MATTDHLFQLYYYSNPVFRDGTTEFHTLCSNAIAPGGSLLEIGAGPSNPTSDFLASLGELTGLDVSEEVRNNRALARSLVYDGTDFGLPANSFDACVSNYVLEHIGNPKAHFEQVARVLKPGGCYALRTPNLLHYVAAGSRMLPHCGHLMLANRLRGLSREAHDPWPTFYRCNTLRRIVRQAAESGLVCSESRAIEKEPSYGRCHPLAFYPMMAFERLVNSCSWFQPFRANILAVFTKP
jgi:SAM-dependent methyltransferase